MDGTSSKATVASVPGLALASPRWPAGSLRGNALVSPRIGPTGLPAGTQAATQTLSQQQTKDTPRSHRLTAAAGSRYVSAPLPEPLSAGGRRQQLSGSSSGASISDSAEARRWSLPAGPLISLQHVPERVADAAEVAVGAAVQPVLQAGHVAQACIASLQQLILNGVAWVAKLLYRLQSMFYIKMRALLGKPSLRLNPQQESGGSIPSSRVPVGISAQPQAASVATWAPQPSGTVTNRGSSGRYTSQARSDGQTCTSHSTGTTTMLVSTQQPMPPTPNGKVVFAAMACATAAATTMLGAWLWRKWKATMERRRELEQLIVVNQASLTRQKQRFQRALVVDSVNLELPPIKEMDVQPGPVQMERIITRVEQELAVQQQSTRSTGSPQAPRLAPPAIQGDHLRQWQQFMAASKATEVKNVSVNTRRSRVQEDSPMGADERTLTDLSERIRRANEDGSAAAAAAQQPVVTFEQLYANNRESDEEAMARRAAERKARWAQQQAAARSGSGDRSASGSRTAGSPFGSVDGPEPRASAAPTASPAVPLSARAAAPKAPPDELTATLTSRSKYSGKPAQAASSSSLSSNPFLNPAPKAKASSAASKAPSASSAASSTAAKGASASGQNKSSSASPPAKATADKLASQSKSSLLVEVAPAGHQAPSPSRAGKALGSARPTNATTAASASTERSVASRKPPVPSLAKLREDPYFVATLRRANAMAPQAKRNAGVLAAAASPRNRTQPAAAAASASAPPRSEQRHTAKQHDQHEPLPSPARVVIPSMMPVLDLDRVIAQVSVREGPVAHPVEPSTPSPRSSKSSPVSSPEERFRPLKLSADLANDGTAMGHTSAAAEDVAALVAAQVSVDGPLELHDGHVRGVLLDQEMESPDSASARATAVNGRRGRRAPAVGPLRGPDTAPALVRLMRRPTVAAAPAAGRNSELAKTAEGKAQEFLEAAALAGARCLSVGLVLGAALQALHSV